ncbi:MAG: transposase [Candidatus Tectimicrobiota bacterium]
MWRPDAPLAFRQPLSASPSADLRLAASKMSGPTRRAFAAEMTGKYCRGNPLLAETMFGWGRHTVEVGLAERRTGIMCLGAPSGFSGRHRWEDEHPEVAEALRRLAEAHAHQDPPCRTPLAYTRLTAQAALAALRAQGSREEHRPAPSTMAGVLNRMGFRLRQVVKAKPQKKMAETEAIFDNLEKKTSKR